MSKNSFLTQVNTQYLNEKGKNEVRDSKAIRSFDDGCFAQYRKYLKEKKTFDFIPDLADKEGNLFSTDSNGIKCILRKDVFKKTYFYYTKHRESFVGKTIKTIISEIDEEKGIVELAGDPKAFASSLVREIQNELKRKESGEKKAPLKFHGTITKVSQVGININILDYNIRGFIEKVDWAPYPIRKLEDLCSVGDIIEFDIVGVCPRKGNLPIQFKCDHSPYAYDPWKSIPDVASDSIILITCTEKPKGKTYWWGVSNSIPGIEMQCDYNNSFNVVVNGVYKAFVRTFDRKKYICRATPFEFVDIDSKGLLEGDKKDETEPTELTNKESFSEDVPLERDCEVVHIDFSEEERMAGYKIGLVNTAFGKGFAFLNDHYFNKVYLKVDETLKPIGQFSPGQAKIDFSLQTGTYTYLVKYVEGTIEQNERYGEICGINYDAPVIFVERFRKKDIVSIAVSDDKVEIARLKNDETIVSNDVISKAHQNVSSNDLLHKGENVFFEYKDSHVELTEIEGDESVTSDELMARNGQIGSIYRIGTVTELFSETGVINGDIIFNISVMDKKTLNILLAVDNATRGSMHIVYKQEKGNVSLVSRISEDFLNLLGWEKDSVRDIDKERKIIFLKSGAIHYLSVLSDGYICNQFSQNLLRNSEIYSRKAMHHIRTNDGIKLMSAALDIRCVEERGLLKYDEQEDACYYFRNQSFKYLISGANEKLKSLDGNTIQVKFVVSEDKKSLKAQYSENNTIENIFKAQKREDEKVKDEGVITDSEEVNDEETETDVIASISIISSSLAIFLLDSVNETDIVLSDDYKKSEDGIEKVITELIRRADEKSLIFAAKMMKTSGIRRVQLENNYKHTYTCDSLIRKVLRGRIKDIINNPNGIYAEYSFYISTLLQNTIKPEERMNLRYHLFAQDFLKRENLPQMVRKKGENWEDEDLDILLDNPVVDVQELLCHILMLDKSGASESSSIIEKHNSLSTAIYDWLCDGRDLGFTKDASMELILQILKKNFISDKKRLTNFLSLEGISVFEKVSYFSEQMDNTFFRYICRDDRARFQEICEINTRHFELGKESDFAKRTRQLTDLVVSCNNLEEEIRNHPTQYALEYLVSDYKLISAFKNMVINELNSLYRSAIPSIVCRPNSNVVTRNTKSLFFVLSNIRDTGNQSLNLQDAKNLRMEVSADTFGMVLYDVKMDNRVVNANDTTNVEIPIDMSGISENEHSIYLTYQITYEYFDAFESVKLVKLEDTLALNIQNSIDQNIDKNKENPYQKYELADKTLIENDMFFGRDRELDQIKSHLIDGEQFFPGKVLILFGQKKCGKTSLVSHFKESIVNELASRTILINFDDFLEENGGALSLENFNLNFYNNILQRFKRVIKKEHRDVLRIMNDNNLEIPNITENPAMAPSVFYSFFEEFAEIDEGQHTIVLIMDEFTRFCSQLKDNSKYHSLANFVKSFSQLGFSQVIIGHDSMMRVLEHLGAINAIAEFSKTIELSSLEPSDARKMIINPMKRTFDIDVYDTPLGKKAVEELQYLSGNSPYYLMKLCSEVFKYYQKLDEVYLTSYHIEQAKRDYVQLICSEKGLATFDTILTEDGDESSYLEGTPTYKYLKCIALKSQLVVTRDCKSDIVCEELGEKETEEIKNLLRSRRVVDERNGQVKIVLGLFREYIIYNYGV